MLTGEEIMDRIRERQLTAQGAVGRIMHMKRPILGLALINFMQMTFYGIVGQFLDFTILKVSVLEYFIPLTATLILTIFQRMP